MTRTIVIADYGVGNLLSLERAIKAIGGQPHRTADPEIIARAGHLILPGVGAFAHCVEQLQNHGIKQAVLQHSKSGNPMLGICVGMQMMLSRSSEFGTHAGLDIIPGHVTGIAEITQDNGIKIPHIGWSRISYHTADTGIAPLFLDFDKEAFVYFVHSFAACPDDARHRLAITSYEGHPITAAINSGNIYGVQFHPEKSGPAGLGLLNSFKDL
ncbi:MAG: imidazole glycerol phosphate synthase subunit HisH [Cohaesibacteraceae bacterium]|nr:imidazole glycerol phosphate synthase subunit HisH [Cohaesibacteraceae bacterium]MBL4875334.1 imidazole glycerol phosphate synthase subunit HisH [Cohaesibacteraceae bacterium]